MVDDAAEDKPQSLLGVLVGVGGHFDGDGNAEAEAEDVVVEVAAAVDVGDGQADEA